MATDQYEMDWVRPASQGTFMPLHEPYGSPAVARRRRRVPLWLALGLAVLLVGTGFLGYAAYHESQVADRWKALATTEASQAASAASKLAAAQSQLAAEAGRVSNLRSLLGAASTVATALQDCITATDRFTNSLGSLFSDSAASAYDQMTATCQAAEAAAASFESQLQNAGL